MRYVASMPVWCVSAATHGSQVHAGHAAGKKHNGRHLTELVKEDPAYCQWIIREAKAEKASAEMKDMAKWLADHAPHLDQDDCIRVGGRRYYGRLVSELVAEDPNFCQWVMRKAEEPDSDHGVRALAKWLNDNAPHLKERGAFASGRHRGRRMSDVVVADPSWCEWMLHQAQDKGAPQTVKDVASWLKANAPHLQAEQSAHVSGGRHSGTPMSQLVAENPAYCQWMLRVSEAGGASPQLRNKAAWLSEHAPHLKDSKYCEGKMFYGRSLPDLVKNEPQYCQWLLRAAEEERATPAMKEQAACIAKLAPYLKEMQVVTFRGAHQGIPLPQVVAEDALWCCFVLERTQAQSKKFVEVDAWLRENVPELINASKVDAATLTQVSQNFFEKYGKFFLVRHGKHRMKTFQAVLQEAPSYVRWVQRTVKESSAATATGIAARNHQFLAKFAELQQVQEQQASVSGCRRMSTQTTTAESMAL